MARKRMTEELLNGRLDTENQNGREVQQQQEWKTKTPIAGSKTKKKTAEKGSSSEKQREHVAEQRKEKVQWPKANSPAWEQWDKDMTEILNTQSTTP